MHLQKVDLSEVFTLLGDNKNTKFYTDSGEEVLIVAIKPYSDMAFRCCMVGKEKTMSLYEATVYTNKLYVEKVVNKKDLLIKTVEELIDYSTKQIRLKLNSAIDEKLLEEWDGKSLIFPKSIIAALLENVLSCNFIGQNIGVKDSKILESNIKVALHNILTNRKD